MHDRCFDYFLHAKNSVITVLWVEFSDRRGIITLYIHQEHHHHHHHRCQHYHRHRRLVQLQDESCQLGLIVLLGFQLSHPLLGGLECISIDAHQLKNNGGDSFRCSVLFFFLSKRMFNTAVRQFQMFITFFFVNKKMFIVQYCCLRVQFVSFRCSVEVLFCQKRMFSITASEFSSSIMIWKERRRVVATVSFDLMNYLLDFIRGHYQWWWHHDVVSSNSNQHAALLALRSKDRADAWKCQLVSWEPCFALEEHFVKGTYWSCDDVPLDIMELD